MTCKTCLHWESKSVGAGRCTCKPPVATLVPQQGVAGPTLAVVTYWPETRAEDHCGEYANNPSANASVSNLTLNNFEP